MPILNWLNKNNAVKTEEQVSYRLLKAVPELSYGDSDTERKSPTLTLHSGEYA